MNTSDHKLALVIIEDYVWIGTHWVITCGVKIGKGAVIVTDVSDYAIAGGVPGKVMGSRKEYYNFD